MRGHRSYAAAALTALFACALIAAGCGDDEETTTTTSVGENAQQTVDAAVTSCTDEANQLGGAAGTALEGACTAVGGEAKQAISEGGENVEQALAKAESSCKSSVGQLPAGQAQDALSKLCYRHLKRRVDARIRRRIGRALTVAPPRHGWLAGATRHPRARPGRRYGVHGNRWRREQRRRSRCCMRVGARGGRRGGKLADDYAAEGRPRLPRRLGHRLRQRPVRVLRPGRGPARRCSRTSFTGACR